MPYLPLRCAWTHFAPSQETLTVTYDPPDVGRLVSVQLEVSDFAGAVVYRSAVLDCHGGPAPLDWTGALNVGNDPVHEPFATPLRAPYTLRVDAVIAADEGADLRQPEDLPNSELDSVAPCEAPRDEARREEVAVLPPPPPSTAQVNVLYHSVDVVRGPWLASGEVFVRGTPASICHKLNQLGYYAGPPARAAVTPDYFDKAKERFRRNHGDLRVLPAPTNLEFEDALDGALGHAHGARPTLVDDQGAPIADGTALGGNGAPMRVYVEAVGFDEDLANQTDEFMRQIPPGRGNNGPINWAALHNKTTSEAGKLNRPLVPLEAVIYLKGHDNRRVAAPQAVGAVRVDWSAQEPGEDVSHLPLNDRLFSGTRAYVNRVLRSDYVDLERNHGSTNCPTAYGGIRTRQHNFRNPFWREPHPYAPYAVPTEDAAAKVLWTPACTDSAAHPARVGRSGIYLQPSLIAGDRYRVRARLSYQGRGNAAALEIANPVCQFETRPIVVWRRVEVFGIVGWPPRPLGTTPQKCRSRYAEAYLEVDFSHTLQRNISAVINHGDYAAWFNHIQTYFRPTINNLAGLVDTTHVHDACPVVSLVPANGLPTDRKNDLWYFVTDMFNEQINAPNVPSAGGFLLSRISNNMRTGHAPCGGIIMLEYRLTDDIREALRTSDIGEIPTTSNGNNDLQGIIDQSVDANADFVFTHEVGHCFWLTHHEASMGVVRQHHDQFDHNCMMSYPDWDGRRPQYPHHAPDRFDPHFCGKCNLKLRGWDITHADILALDAETPPDGLKTLFYYDRADPGLQWNVELSHVSDAFTRVSRGPFQERYFDQNANFDTWMTDLGDCDIYHHVTHGNVRCSRHRSRLASMDMAIPRYPTWCRDSDSTVRKLATEEQDICERTNFDAQALTTWAKKNFITPQTYFHDLSSVIQWTVDLNDSSRDVEFTYEQVQRAFKRGQNAPRLLAFFSSCLIGWERRFAKLFIDQGTRYVIAFRSRYQTSQALPFSREFYRMLSAGQFDADMVNTAFNAAAMAFPHAEPCLFTAAKITRCRAQTRAGTAAFTEHTWKDSAFDEPRFPTP